MHQQTAHVSSPIREATLDLLKAQIRRGFQPDWLITFHYASPIERGWNGRCTGIPRPITAPSLYAQPTRTGIARARNDFFQVSRDARHIRNLLRRAIWGVKRQEQVDESETPMIFFHEKGMMNIQYHTHLLLGSTPPEFKTIESIEAVWNGYVLPRAQCLSRTNSVDVRAAETPMRACGYLTKELRFRQEVVDYEASCLFRC